MNNIPKAPIGAVSAAILVAMDSVWGTIEAGATASVVAAPSVPIISAGVFVLTTAAVAFLQRYVEHDDWQAALSKGFACGVLAGVPFPIMGTGAGAALLGWAGLHRLSGGNNQMPKELPEPDQKNVTIIENKSKRS